MTKIIVGVEDSSRSRDAVAFARELAATAGATLVLANAYPHGRVPSRAVGADFDDRFYAESEAILVRMRLEAGDVPVETRPLGYPSPAHALHQLAREEDAALLVIGSSERSDLGRVLAGTTAERLLHGAPCPVAVVPNGYRTAAGPIRRVLLAYDDGREAKAALAEAVAVARAAPATLRVVQVVPPTTVSVAALAAGAAYLLVPEELRRDARERLEDEIASLEDANRIELDIGLGDPVKEIVKRSAAADLLVTGSRAYGPHCAVLLGSVSGRLVRRAACPVLVVPRGGEGHLQAWLGATAAAA